MASASPSPMAKHLVVPGQIIAVSSENDEGAAEGFLRGHGTYIETIPGDGGGPSSARAVVSSGAGGGADDDGAAAAGGGGGGGTKRLVASVAGTVERVNKLVSVVPLSSSVYAGQVGDLVVGRISAVGPTRWRVALSLSPPGAGAGLGRAAQLPLSGADLPGGVQRIRTAEDARGMRRLYGEGDLLSAEVQQVAQADGTLVLHTRSLRYGRLENGCAVQVPPGLVRRMRQHMCTLAGIGVDVLIGCNGGVWIQRAMPKVGDSDPTTTNASNGTPGGAFVDEDGAAPLAETLQGIRQRHAATAVLPDERERIARVRNSVECLRMVHCFVTPDTIRLVYDESLRLGLKVGEMMRPDQVLAVTEPTRARSQ